MSEVLFIIIFIIVLIVPACLRAARRSQEERDRRQAAGLQAFRQQQQAQRMQQQGQQQQATDAHPQPTAPESESTRKASVKKHLYHRTLENGESVRNLSMLLAAANDRYEDTDKNGNVIARSWRSAEASVNKFVGHKPECSICLCPYEDGETVCWAKNDECDHIFHEDCIVQWLVDHDECPLCRTNLLEYDGMNEDQNV